MRPAILWALVTVGAAGCMCTESAGVTTCTACEETYPCGDRVNTCVASSSVPVAERLIDFESECAAPACETRTESGTVSVGPSFHPGDHALQVGAGAVVELRLSTNGTADGASISLNARCDQGTSLRLEGDGTTTLYEAAGVVADGPVWRRWEAVLRDPTSILDDPSAARTGVTTSTLRFSSRGGGVCQLDRVRYVLSARVCTRHELVQGRCCRATTTPADGGRTGP